jgi:hypothetical protein
MTERQLARLRQRGEHLRELLADLPAGTPRTVAAALRRAADDLALLAAAAARLRDEEAGVRELQAEIRELRAEVVRLARKADDARHLLRHLAYGSLAGEDRKRYRNVEGA